MIKELNNKIFEYHGKVDVFGLILFTEANPYVVKMLKDPDYWNALNEISGEHIAVFTARLFNQEYSENISCADDSMGFLIPIMEEPSSNKQVMSWFDVSDTNEFPVFVLFCIEDQSLYHIKYSLKSNSPESLYQKLKEPLLSINEYFKSNETFSFPKQKIYKDLNFKIKKLKTKNFFKKLIAIAATARSASDF